MTIDITPQVIKRLEERIRNCSRWAHNNRPNLVHLALHAKKPRTRKKNLVRIVREYMKESKP